MKLLFYLVSCVLLVQGFEEVIGHEYSTDYFKTRTHASEESRICPTRKVICSSEEKFSKIDGSCQNIENPSWGSTNTVLQRFLPPEYADNRGAPRSQGKFGKLPSTRKITTILRNSNNQFSNAVSHMHVIWGQLMAHDIVFTPVVDTKCECGESKPDCINIKIPKDDVQSVKGNRECMKLPRSRSAKGINNCTFASRQQMSLLSSFIDASFLYGESEEQTKELRDLDSVAGQLTVARNRASKKQANLPNQDQLRDTNIQKIMQCPVKVHVPLNIPCFVAGDIRVNENPGLTSIHTIMIRYHNYVAKGLKLINPFWDGNRVFNEARHILCALTQLVTFREYLPLLLGPKWIKRFRLELNDEGYWNGYDPRQNPTIMNEFATAAFRYGHSQITGIINRPGTFFNRNAIPKVQLAGAFFNSTPFLEKNGGGSGAILRGFMTDKAEKTDTTLVDALHNQLNTEIGENFGDDLFAINAQRGRDHGLPGYTRYRELCGLPPVSSFSDLSDVMSYDTIQRLMEAYKSVDDIDLYLGGIGENQVEGGQIGPTFACIVAYGFRGLRRGDRYWHEYENSPNPFTVKQLSSLRRTTLASILCVAGEDMKFVVKKPLQMKDGKRGDIVSCDRVGSLDLSAWKETSNKYYSDRNIVGQTEWTTWFVTPFRNTEERTVEPHIIKEHFLRQKSDRICNDILHLQTRKSRFDVHLQVRFLCSTGTITATDFPYQLSQDTYWTLWQQPKHAGYYGGQSFQASDFDCANVVFIQVRSGSKFAMETDYVFAEHSSDGFTCIDKHQPNGRCGTFEARALCVKTFESFKRKQEIPILSPAPFTIETKPKHTHLFGTKSIDEDIKNIVIGYCNKYSICCSTANPYYRPSAPTDVLRYAKHLCETYDLCCDV